MDEIAELGIAAAGIRDIVDVADGFPPSYHFLLRGWLGIFGADSAARWLSVLFGVLTIPVIWNLGRDVGGRGVAAWSATLLALAPLHNWFSREARAYSLYVLVAALAMWLFFRALDRNGRADWLAFALVAVCGVYVHYFFPVLLAVSVLVLLAALSAGADGPVRRALDAAAIVAPGVPRLALAAVFCCVFFAISGGIALAADYAIGDEHRWSLFIASAYVLAWLTGFLVPGASGGLGVREAALLLLLTPQTGEPAALALALSTRLITTLGDVVFAGSCRRLRPGPGAAGDDR